MTYAKMFIATALKRHEATKSAQPTHAVATASRFLMPLPSTPQTWLYFPALLHAPELPG